MGATTGHAEATNSPVKDGASLSLEDIYIGFVKTQSRRDPSKYFIECRELKQLFDFDVKMEASDKPSDVRVGDLVVFMLSGVHGKQNRTPVAWNVKRVDYAAANIQQRAASVQEPEPPPVYAMAASGNAQNFPRLVPGSKTPSAYEREAPAGLEEQIVGPPVYTGLIRNQSKKDPSKYFIECPPELQEQYGCDIKLLDIEKPADVEIGDMVEFIIMEVDFGAPLAVNVSKVPVARAATRHAAWPPNDQSAIRRRLA